MGNITSESNPLFIADELDWKTGALVDSIPAPVGGLTTYEALRASTVFKEYLMKHIDSDHLASSVMNMADVESALLKGIDKYKELEPEWVESLQNLVENFQLCTAAGMEVKDFHPLSMCEKQISMSFKSSQAIFLASFQRRLACLRIMQICIELERKDALATFPTKKSSEAEGSVANQAQMMVLHGLKNAGISLITLFPMCYNALQEAAQRELLAQPVRLFCDHLCNMANLELLKASTASITEAADPRILDLQNNAEISASSGTPSNVRDGIQDTYWSGTHLSITLNTPCNVASITMAWVPKYKNHYKQGSDTAAQNVCAPRRIALFARTLDAEGVEQPQEKVFCVMPTVEYSRSGSWVQTYKVDLTRVKTLKFTLSIQACEENTSGVSKLFNLEINCADDAISSKIRALPLLKKVQHALVPLAGFPDVAKLAYDAQLSIVRASGSLSAFLMLVNTLHSTNAERTVQQKSAPAVLRLLQAINSTNHTVRSTYNKTHASEGNALSDVKFLSTTCEITNNSSGHSSVSCQHHLGAAQLSFVLNSTDTTYEWTFTIDEEMYGDESIFLGVVGESCRAATPENILKSTEAYFIRIYNGEIFQGRRCCALPVSAMHPGDQCRFTYHPERKTVSLRVNNVQQGVVFDNISAAGLRPCVLFQPSAHRKTVSVSNVSLISRKISNNNNNTHGSTVGENEKTKLPLGETATLSTVENAPCILSLLLSAVEELAVAKREELLCTSNAALVHAYCAEASVEVIVLLISLVQKLHSPLNTHHSMVHSLLVILDLQFQCIKLSKIDLRDLGFHRELGTTLEKTNNEGTSVGEMSFESLSASFANTGRFTDPNVTYRALAAASDVLQELMSSPHAALSSAAVVAFSHGLSFFLPSTERKLALVADILRDLNVSDVKQVLQAPRFKLLQLLVQRFRDTGEILGFIDFVASDPLHADTLASLMTVFLDLLSSLQGDNAGLTDSSKFADGLSTEAAGEVEPSSAQKIVFMNDLAALLSTYQQQLVYEILSTGPHPISATYAGDALKTRQQQLSQGLLLPYLRALLSASRKFILLTMGADIAQESRRDAILRDSVVGALVHPLLYSLCLPGFELSFYQEICPDLVKLLELLTQYSAASNACAVANNLILSTVSRASGTSNANKSGLGWRAVKACFEDGEGTFTATEGNTIFTSTTTNNTAAVVTTKFTSKHKAAWEFLLLADSSGDECSTFGAARLLTPSSRCYSSSTDLWMRRAYNGYLYQFGASTGHTMDKIKPGDLVRVEFDGPAGTISYSVNGGDLQVAFSNITDDVYPACGSYRNGVAIKLVKVEIFDTLKDEVEDEVAAATAFARPTPDIKWVLPDDAIANTRDATLLSPAVPKGSKLKTPTMRWMTARANRGALYGVHEYTFELTQANKSAYSVGIVTGGNPYALDRLAGPCLKISSKTPKTCEIAGSSLSLNSGGSVASAQEDVPAAGSVTAGTDAVGARTDIAGAGAAVAVSIAPATVVAGAPMLFTAGTTSVAARIAALARAASVASTLAGATPVPPAPPITFMPSTSEADRSGSTITVPAALTAPSSPNITRASSPAPLDTTGAEISPLGASSGSGRVREQTPEIPLSRTYRYPLTVLALAWLSDGSLWHNGVKVADDYGASVLPLNKSAAITMRVDRAERTVSFSVNGISLGVAFGPVGSGAKAPIALPPVGSENTVMFPSEHRAVFPAGSVASSAQALRIRSTGFRGSTVVPLQMSVQRALTSVLGRLSALLIQGPSVSASEAALIPWFASNLMIGGVDETKEIAVLPADSVKAETDMLVREIIDSFAQYSTNSSQKFPRSVDILLVWLEKVDPEPDFLRKVLERSGSYRFLDCEMPFIACLLKHSGLGAELAEVLRKVRSERHDGNEPFSLPTASKEMVSLWQRVKQLRAYLRQQRQSFRSISAVIESQSAKVMSTEPEPVEPVTPAAATTSTELPPRPSRPRRRTRLSEAARRAFIADDGAAEEASTAEEEKEDQNDEEDTAENSEEEELEEIDSETNPLPDTEERRALEEILASISESMRQASSPRAEPQASATPTPDSSASLTDEVGIEALIYYSDRIHWTPQPTSVISQRSPSDRCSVLAVGIDFVNELIFVRLHETFSAGADTHKAFQNAQLSINETVSMTAVEVQCDVKTPQERRGCLRYDYSSIAPAFLRSLTAKPSTASLKFRFGQGNYTLVDLVLPSNHDVALELTALGINLEEERNHSSAVVVSDTATEQFRALCDAIREKAEFLLTLTPAVKALDSSNYRSKSTLLRTLTKRFSGNFPVSGSTEDLSRWRAEERWKRVVQFLRVQSHLEPQRVPSANPLHSETVSNWDIYRASRTPSTTNLPTAASRMVSSGMHSEIDLDEEVDSDSPVLATMQACAVFMISDGVQSTPTELKQIMQTRLLRAESRVLGLKTLQSVLDIVSDPLMISDLLLFVRSALKVTLPASVKISPQDNVLQAMISKHHYLNCLEGCSVQTLAKVQNAFMELYAQMSSLLRRCIVQWENSARRACVRFQDGAGSPTRSFRSILLKNEDPDELFSDSDPSNTHILLEPIHSLLELWTLHFSTRDHGWLNRVGVVTSLTKLTSLVFQEEIANIWRDTAERYVEFSRANAVHMSGAWEMWSKEYVQQGLRNGTLTMRKLVYYLYNIPVSELSDSERTELGLSNSFAVALDTWNDSKAVDMFYKVLKRVSQKKFVKDSELKKQEMEKQELENARAQKITERLIPCGTFDPAHKGSHINVAGYNLEAHIADDGGGNAECVYSNVKYDIAAGSALTGNYFEVTIVEVGRQAIGIGFANRDTFSASGYMPGWEPHSYGYHGDDGHKFGNGSTSGDWPLFETNDVIGCGFNFTDRSIFYTRNGVLLGTGFTNVPDSYLWPVVGFANRTRMKEHVKINFGIQRFAYLSSTAVGHPLALEECNRADEEALNDLFASNIATGEDASGSGIVSTSTSLKSNVTCAVPDNKKSSVADLLCRSQAEFLVRDREFKAQLAAADAFNQELSTLRQQGCLVLRFLLTLASNSDHDGLDGNTIGDIAVAKDESATGNVVPPIPVLAKEVSLFGTPKAITSADGVCLQEGIVAHLLHELQLAAAYLQGATSGGRTSFLTLQRAQDFPGLGGTMTPSAGPTGLISAEEVSKEMQSQLILIASLFDSSKPLQDSLRRPQLLKALFSIVELPYVPSRDVAFCLLGKLLPSMQPEVVDSALGSEWLSAVRRFDELLVGSPYRKRQGKMPIQLIQGLALTSATSIGTGTASSVSPGKHLPYGAGTRALELVDLKMHLLQKLFEAPAWTELVACGVTDSLRYACSALDQLCFADDAVVTVKVKSAQEVDLAVLELACAACATLSTVGVCRTGSSIQISGDSQGVLLSHSEVTQSATYVADRNSRAVNPSLHIHTVPLTSIEPVARVVGIDLTDLSQPLLQQFFQLAEKVFKWYCAQRANHSVGVQSTTHGLLLRLASLVSLTLSQLLTHQNDVINFVHDSSIIADLLTISLSTSPFAYIPSCAGVIKMWRETQMRCLELPSPLVSDTDTSTVVRAHSTEGPVSDVAASSAVSEALNIDAARQAERLQASKQLAAELDAEERLCLLFLDFHMMNIQDAKESIIMVKAKGTVDASLLSFFADSAAAEKNEEEVVTFEDSNLLNKISNYDPADLLLSNANPGTAENSERTQMCLLSVLEYARRTETSPTPDDLVLLVQSELDGRRGAVMGVRQYVQVKDLLDAVTAAAKHKPLVDSTSGKSKVEKTPDCFLLTHFHDARFGYINCDLIDPTMTHRIVSALFDDVALRQLTAFRAQLDQHLTVHSARRVAARLLRDGNLTLQQDLPRDNSWINLVKLMASSGCESFENIVPSLCTTLASTEANEGETVSAEVNALVADVTYSLCKLSNPLSLSQVIETSGSDEEKCSFLEFCSPHPFPAPSETTGVIRIPDHWKNVSLQFHPKCSTPTSQAVLEIFASEEALAARTPLLSLSGLAANWVKAQNKCISGPLSCLWYRFTAAPASDRQTFPLVTIDSLTFIRDNTCELPASNGKVGLGEEDSLFNLFNTEAEADEGDVNTGMVECGVDFIPSGAWYYEATLTGEATVGSSQCMIGIISSDFSSSDSAMLTSVHSCGLFGDGLVCMQSALKHHDDQLGEWQIGDVLGCLFDLSSSSIAMWVSRNNVWSPKLTGEISTAGWKPAVHIAGACKLSLNWGESRFAFPPPAEIVSELSAQSYQGVAVYIPADEDPAVSALRNELAWGYHFAVKPFLNVRTKVCTEFELVKKLAGESTSNIPKFWIWRPKPCEGFLPWGDIITSTEYPPRRSILFDKKECVAPEGCKLVFSCSKLDIAVYRITPPPGYVSLGDVVTDYSASTRAVTFAHKILCIPEWAVAPCHVSKFLTKIRECGSGKEISTGSLWSIDNGLGGFFGSPFEVRHANASESRTKSSAFECFGVATGYALLGDVDLESKLTGEWTSESNVLTASSLRWTVGLLKSLLLSPGVRSQVLTPAVFSQLVQFLRSSATPRPLAAVPLLIQMIRLAQKHKVKLPLEEIKSLCKAILTFAMTFTGSKSSKIPSSLLKLVDFVIEIQIAHIEDSYEKENFNLWRRYVLCTDGSETSDANDKISHTTYAIESKEEDDACGGIESKESDAPAPPVSTDSALVERESEHMRPSETFDVRDIVADLQELSRREHNTVQSGQWWDRVLVPPGLLRLHRGLRLSNVENIFGKDSTIVRLRQVLKFVNALVSNNINSIKDISSTSAVPRPYPRLLSSKIWHDLVSVSTVEESSHPYRSSSHSRRVHFPGAEKLVVTFDRRCALAPGDTLRLCTPATGAPDLLCLSSTTSDDVWTKGLTVQGDELTFVFASSAGDAADSTAAGDAAASNKVNPDNLWGWSCVVHAQGSSIYARADTALNLSELAEIQPVDTSVDDVVLDSPKSKASDTTKANTPVSPFREVINGLTASVPAGSTAFDFATTTLNELHNSKIVIVPGSHPTESTSAADWAMQLICLRGQVLCTGEIAVPTAHSLKMLLDRIPGTPSEESSEQTANVLVVEFTPRFTQKSGHHFTKPAGAVFRVCVSGKFEHSHHGFVRGDLLHYKVFGMTQTDLLKILSAVPVAADPSAVQVHSGGADSPLNSGDGDTLGTVGVSPLVSSALLPDTTLTEGREEVIDLTAAGEEEGAAVIIEDEVDTSEQMWACEVCTLLNAPHLTECNACTSLRPSAAAGGGAAAAAQAGWWCTVCTLINPISERMCAACGTARDPTAETAEDAEEENEEDDEEEEHSAESSHTSEDGDNDDANSATSDDSDGDEDAEEGEEEEEDEGEEEEPEAVAEEARDAQADSRSPGRPARINDAATAGRMSGEVKARVLNIKAGDDLLVITVEGKMTETEEFEARLLGAMASKGRVLTPAQMMCGLSDWSKEADSELIEHINALPGSTSSNHLFALPKKFLTYSNYTLASKNLLEVQIRAQHIERFNRHLEHLLSFVDLASDDPHSLGAMIRKCNRYLLLKVKTPLLDSAVSSTTVTSGKDCPANVILDNAKSLHSRDRGEKDPVSSQNCFVQAFQQLREKDSLVYRCLTSSDRVFQTSFVGESGIDAGGVYREAMSRIVEDLFSEHFDLLLLCPNAQHQVHSNMDKYIPNPQHIGSKLVREMFEFIGKLMAVSVRTKLYLPFEFPPIIWKKLVGEDVGLEDFMAMDAIACKQVEAVRAWDLETVDPSKLRFEYQGSDKVERELVPGGKNKAVTCENRAEYCDAVVAARLNEFNEATAAMARGMQEVIPSRALWLFSSSQLETLVCGNPVFDMELWKKKTDSTGVSAKTVALFWKVMETLTQKELSGFVRFAWGRSRLPAAKEFTTKMRLTNGGTAALPVSHTCFFSVELPEYPTEEAMRHGLLTAIHYGVGGILNG